MISSAVFAMLLFTAQSHVVGVKAGPNVGEEYEISRTYKTSGITSRGSSSSSGGTNSFLERIVGVQEAGLELEYDMPKGSSKEERSRNWQFPARVFRPFSGPTQLLNHRDLEARVDNWLEAGKLTRAACGRWYFTWNAFKIECDPQSVIKTIEAIDLSSTDLREDASYKDAEALGAGTLVRKSVGPAGSAFAVNMEVDPDAVRRTRAESDVTVGELIRKPITLAAALRERAKERISGTISVTFKIDSAGNAWQRTKVTKLETKRSDGETETDIVTETVERRPLQAVPANR